VSHSPPGVPPSASGLRVGKRHVMPRGVLHGGCRGRPGQSSALCTVPVVCKVDGPSGHGTRTSTHPLGIIVSAAMKPQSQTPTAHWLCDTVCHVP
jgi:hypothetical protein